MLITADTMPEARWVMRPLDIEVTPPDGIPELYSRASALGVFATIVRESTVVSPNAEHSEILDFAVTREDLISRGRRFVPPYKTTYTADQAWNSLFEQRVDPHQNRALFRAGVEFTYPSPDLVGDGVPWALSGFSLVNTIACDSIFDIPGLGDRSADLTIHCVLSMLDQLDIRSSLVM